MKPASTTRPGRPAGRLPLGAITLFLLAPTLLIACGVTLGSGEKQTEFFKQLAVGGDPVTGGEMTVAVDYAQPYPTDVEIECDLLTSGKPAPTVPPRPTNAAVPGVPPTPVPIPRARPTPGNFAGEIFRQTIGSNDHGGPADQATPVLSSTAHKFRAPNEPGRYTVVCYTPADDNNQIRKTVLIRQGPPPTATP